VNKKCKNLYAKLNGIKKLLAGYNSVYGRCVEKKDFTPLKKKKELLQKRILVLHKMIYPELKLEQMEQVIRLKQRVFGDPRRHLEVLKKDIYIFMKQRGLSGQVTFSEEDVQKICEKGWNRIEKRLRKNSQYIDTLILMEKLYGEPDVIWYDEKKDKYSFVDCSEESPGGSSYLCYDRDAEKDAKKRGYSPKGNVIDMAKKMGIKVLSRPQYLKLQKLIPVDLNTQSWIKTTAQKRKEGVALVGSRFGSDVEIFELEADDCNYGPRGFRGVLEI